MTRLSEYAEERLVENRQHRSKFLDLGNCSLTEIPESLFEHSWIEALNFSAEWWDWRMGAKNRVRRASINFGSYNNIQALPDLFHKLPKLRRLWLNGDVHSRFSLSNINALARLKNLEVLGLASTCVATLRSLRTLTRLRYLDLWNVESLSSLAPLSGMQSLELLDVWGTSIKSLRPLETLDSLQFVNLGDTLVSSIEPLAHLFERDIDVDEEGAPEETTSGIFVGGCNITRPPPEIVRGGAKSISVFLSESKAQGLDHLYEAKLLIVGEGGSGKTSLLRRLYLPQQALPAEDETTKGISILRHKFPIKNGKKFRLNVWDFGGQEIYHATHQFFLTKRSIYVLLDDTRRDNKAVQDEGFKYWLEVVDSLSAHSPLLIFQNEKGGRAKSIDEQGIRERFTNVAGVYKGDLSDPASVDRVRESIELHVQNLPHVGEALPAKWLLVRADLEKLAQSRPYVAEKDYFDVYARHLTLDKERALYLSRYLHDLGVFLHFQDDPLLKRTVVLQNEWATEAVFKVFDSNRVKANFGQFTVADCETIWNQSDYADMHPELLALMQKFELCYRLDNTSPAAFLAPLLLSPSKPKTLEGWERPGDLVIKYRYDFMPKGLINRLMVRQHRYVRQPNLGWISGVFFENESNEVLAVHSPSGSEITLRARGVERKSLLAVISADLDTLNAAFHAVEERVQKLIPCCCDACLRLPTPEFFLYSRLLQRKRDRKLLVECPSSYENVSVLALLDGVEATSTSAAEQEAIAKQARRMQRAKNARTISIFIASSDSLLGDRDAFDLYFRQQNDYLIDSGVYIKIERWEQGSSAMWKTRSQDEYNAALANCDMLVCLVSTRVGEYTLEEYEAGLALFEATGKPLIYTYFKNEKVSINDVSRKDFESVKSFQDKLQNRGHFWSKYADGHDLQLQFRKQLDIWAKSHDL